MAIRAAWAIVPVVVLTATLGACANDRADAPESFPGPSSDATTATSRARPTTTLPDLSASAGLAASIRQYREDEVAGVIQVQLVRSPDGDPADLLTVRSVRLEWPGFAPVDATERPVALAPGQRVDVPTPLGAAICARSTPSSSEGVAVLEIDEPAGTRTVEAPLLADAQTALDNVHSKECVRQRIEAQVGLRFSPSWQRTDSSGTPAAAGAVIVTRRDTDERVRVAGVDGSVLLVVTPVEPFGPGVATLAPDEADGEVPIRVVASGRCDGHALGDSKKTYAFQVQVAIGDDEPTGVEVVVPEAERGALTGVIADTCAATRGG